MDAAAKQQIVERVKQASNILVTVSSNPSVDQLAACIGLTLLLNRMEKHATAVFSGTVPSTLEFLQPEKTIETNTDSLRDFIISLDKNKADKLRYKVEDQVVRIFITPYKTSLSEKDLVFSQGDYNVEVVMALGITDKAQIDAAITSHGRILHDATIISLNAGAGKAPGVGQINWQEPSASSLCEMVVSISEAFGAGLIDNQMATAFLTGIVAETQRFSNPKTSPKVMTMSAQLMAAGANQQLIVSKLEPVVKPVQKYNPPDKKSGAKTSSQAAPPDGALTIPHEEPTKPTTTIAVPELSSEEIHIDAQGNIQTAADQAQPLPAPPEPEPEVPKPAPPAKKAPEPEEKPPGPHALLGNQNNSADSTSVFTANARPEWADPYNTVPIDPLNTANSANPFAEPSDKTPSVDQARSAVESAISAAPTELNIKPDTKAKDDAEPAAPPFPPPLTPTDGVVIPAANSSDKPK